MNRSTKHHEISGLAAWARRAATVAAVLAAGLGVALAAFAAPLPAPPATATPYSWPNFHAGGVPTAATTPPSVAYHQLQGTPTGLYGAAPGVAEQIPSRILGNTGAGTPTLPPGSGGTNGYTGISGSYRVASFLNHFFNGPNFQSHYFQIAGPLGFTAPAPGAPAPFARVQSSPTVVNASEYQEIAYMYYDGVAASPQNPIGNGTVDRAADPTPSGTPPVFVAGVPTPPAAPVTTGTRAIRQVVYYGRTETLPVVVDPTTGLKSVGGVPVPATAIIAEGTPVTVGAIYAMDGFTGGIIWRYQTPSFNANSAAATNGFASHITGTAQSATLAGPQPFQIGPDAHNTGGTTDDTVGFPGADGVFDSYTPVGTLPAAPAGGYHFALYAKTATLGANNTVTYTGDWRIFPSGSNADDANIVAYGTFTATATFDLVTDPTGHLANVTATFTAGSGTSPSNATASPLAAGFPAQFNGTFDARSGAQIISGNLDTIPGGGGSATLRDAGVLSSLAVARVNVEVPAGYPGFNATTGTATSNLATKLVVIATDNNGYVYCLDALGNGYRDPAPESNGNVLYQNTSAASPNYTTDLQNVGQVHYEVLPSQTFGGFVTDTQPHIGTTFPYWVYRPDANAPKYVAPVTGSQTVGNVKAKTDFDTTRDLPVPQAFDNASPTVYVNPAATVDYNLSGATPTLGTLAPGAGPGAYSVTMTGPSGNTTGPPPLASNATVFAGNSNGVLYALDTLGVTGATGLPDPNGNTYNNSVTGNPGIDDTGTPANTPNTTNTLWWFTAPGAIPSDPNNNPVSIQSAPAVYAPATGNPSVYVGTSNPNNGSNNSGRLYAIDAVAGPTGNAGAGSAVPGSTKYNVDPKGEWSFPDSYGSTARAALGNITGSPVVFNNTDDGTTRIYFAANTGNETVTEGTGTQTFPPSDDTGRVWGVNTDGSFGFAYPTAGDPNSAAPGAASPPLGGFLHATPAIGFVTFPGSIYYLDSGGAPVAYTHTDSTGTTSFSSSANRTIPMLYVGTNTASGVTGSNLYYVDLDGTTDDQRTIYVLPAPNGSSFQSSPILVTNTASSTAGGNGGSVFITTADNHLVQFQATPITTANLSAPYPTPRTDYTFPAGDAVSAPAVGAAKVSDFTGTAVTNPITGVTTTVSESVTDWVYVGDFSSGLCFGFTPRGFGTDTTGNFLPTILPPVPPNINYPPVVNQFPLRAYIYDNTAAHPASSTDMTKANPYGQSTSALPIFEWGQTAYLRIGNVVPPLPLVVGGSPPPTSATDPRVLPDPTDTNDPNGPTYQAFYAGGGPITFQTTEIDESGQNIPGTIDTFTVPATIISTPSVAAPDPSQMNGFYERSDAGTTPTGFGATSELDGSSAARAPETVLLDNNGRGYAAAVAYSVGFASGLDPAGARRHNTPGVRRKLINVLQTATRYAPTPGGGAPQQQTVQLHLVTDPNFTYQTTDSSGNAETGNLYVDEPTFGILNPLAVRGAGVGLTGGGSHAPWVDANGVEGAGPFRGVNTTLKPTDMQALANGNSVLTLPPPSGVLVTATDPTKGVQTLTANAAFLPNYRYVITTTTGQVGHGTNGDNTDPNPLALPTGGKVADNSDVSGLPADTNYGSFLLDIADRSMLGLAPGGPAINVSIQRAGLAWTDNTGGAGPGARVNPLAWDDYPLAGQNNSLDYPDIGSSNLTEYLGGDTTQPLIAPSRAQLPVATASTSVGTDSTFRVIRPDTVEIAVHVPKYQPANLQLWHRSSAAEGPQAPLNYVATDLNFPMGYVARQRVAASSAPGTTPNTNPRDTNVAYREVWVYTGVPVDMSTSISNNVTDTGTVLHGYGLATQSYANASAAIPQGLFAPTNPSYQPYFQPLTIYNNGNTNLINPHLDQKLQYNAANSVALPLLSDALDSTLFDPLSYIPAYDYGNVRTGPRTGTLPGVYTEQPFLLRSSLDTDLANAYGINPGVGAKTLYPVVTYHKPRVGDAANPGFPGTLMTVPDQPHDFTPGYSGGYPKPSVSVAVPIGTPAGTYAQTVLLFEGLDTPYDPLKGPLYGGVEGGSASFDPSASDTLKLFQAAGSPTQKLQPYSDPGTTVKVTVKETRLSDGFTPGTLPMVDAAPANGTGAADFLPAAFRDPATGALSLYWTTARGYTPGSPLLSIVGANLAMTGGSASSPGYFTPYAATSNWWDPFTAAQLPLPTTRSNVGLSVAADQPVFLNGVQNTGDGTVYAFATSVLGSGPSATTNVYCYPVTPGTGALTGIGVPVVTSTQPKSGVHGLKVTGVSFADPNGGSPIASDLWAFWAGGARGRTALYFSSAASAGVGSYTAGGTSPFTGAAILPVPASLSAVSDPTAVLAYAPDPTAGSAGTPIPVIEVTYAGAGAAGGANVYISRYRPYHPKAASGAVNGNVTLLAALPFPRLTEQLQPQPGANWWQARDVAWLRNGNLNVYLGSTPLLSGLTPTYDRASGLLVYTGVTLNGVAKQTVFVDIGAGRVRFSLPLPAGSVVSATFNPTARRITTDPVADTAPDAVLDETYQPNTSGVGPHVQADRYWFFWHKAALAQPELKVAPSLWYKTQRLTVALTDASGTPLSIGPAGGSPNVTVTLGGSTLYAPTTGGVVDVDATRGRLYFPITAALGGANVALEGQTVSIVGANAAGGAIQTTGVIHWVDEPRYNDPADQIAANNTTPGAQEAVVSDGYLVPINTIKNESGVTAFLDPYAYQNASGATATLFPHSLWLFWNSTRNGTSDIFYETINPRFSPVIPSSGAP